MALLQLQQHQQQQQQQQVHVGCGGVANGFKRVTHKLPITTHGGSSSSNSKSFAFSSSLIHLHQSGNPVTLDLFQSKLASVPVELDEPHPLPFGLQRFLDLKTGEIYYKDTRIMSQPKLDLKLNLSPPRVVNQQATNRHEFSPNGSVASSPTSSCVSSEEAETETSMVLVGCPRCLMYVMLAEDDPKCPKCKSTVLLDFLHNQNNNSKNKKTSKKQ